MAADVESGPSIRKWARRFVVALTMLAGSACVDSGDLRAEWFRRLVKLERHAEALEVYAGLEEQQRELAPLRYQALIAQLGVRGYGSGFVQLIARAFESHPQELWLEPRFARLEVAEWGELLVEAEGLSRPVDEEALRRTLAGTRYAASLILLRDALRRSGNPTGALGAFRRAVAYCADMPPHMSGRFAELNQIAKRNAQEIGEQIGSLNDAALLAWLRARESGVSR